MPSLAFATLSLVGAMVVKVAMAMSPVRLGSRGGKALRQRPDAAGAPAASGDGPTRLPIVRRLPS
jgi:hypothetical protein